MKKAAFGSAIVLMALLLIGGISTAADIQESVAQAAAAEKPHPVLDRKEYLRRFEEGFNGGYR
jgi:hypothetical protein